MKTTLKAVNHLGNHLDFWRDRKKGPRAIQSVWDPNNWSKDSALMIFLIYLEPVCPLFWGLNPPKGGRNSNQNKVHWSFQKRFHGNENQLLLFHVVRDGFFWLEWPQRFYQVLLVSRSRKNCLLKKGIPIIGYEFCPYKISHKNQMSCWIHQVFPKLRRLSPAFRSNKGDLIWLDDL